MWIFVLSAVAWATKVSVREVPCPVGPGTAKVYTKVSANRMGGTDADLASYSTQGQFRTWAISTCPTSMLSLYGEDMAQKLPGAKLAEVEALLARIRPTLPQDPQVWDRYHIAAQVYETLGWGPTQLGDLYLEASWTARDHAVGVYVGLNGPQGADQTLKESKAALAGDVTPEQRRVLLYNVARIAHRAGYENKREAALKALASSPGVTSKEQQAITRMHDVATTIEPKLQRLALAHYEQALPQLKGVERARILYLRAELLRRLGQPKEALAGFTQASNHDDLPAELREMAIYLATRLGG